MILIILSYLFNFLSTSFQSFKLLNRKAFTITDTELKDIASAAIIGDSNIPKNGYKTPAAIGTPNTL